jgi:hypothetical protein
MFDAFDDKLHICTVHSISFYGSNIYVAGVSLIITINCEVINDKKLQIYCCISSSESLCWAGRMTIHAKSKTALYFE